MVSLGTKRQPVKVTFVALGMLNTRLIRGRVAFSRLTCQEQHTIHCYVVYVDRPRWLRSFWTEKIGRCVCMYVCTRSIGSQATQLARVPACFVTVFSKSKYFFSSLLAGRSLKEKQINHIDENLNLYLLAKHLFPKQQRILVTPLPAAVLHPDDPFRRAHVHGVDRFLCPFSFKAKASVPVLLLSQL